MGFYGNGMSGGGWVFVGLFWIALIAVIVWLVLELRPSNSRADSTQATSWQSTAAPQLASPLEILDRRLARGDIDIPTYQAHRAALTETHAGDR